MAGRAKAVGDCALMKGIAPRIPVWKTGVSLSRHLASAIPFADAAKWRIPSDLLSFEANALSCCGNRLN